MIKRALVSFLLVAAIVLALGTSGVFSKSTQPADTVLAGLKAEAIAAVQKAEFKAGDGLLADDYVGMQSDGKLLSMSQGDMMLYSSTDADSLKATVLGNTAVVTGLMKVRGAKDGKAVTAIFRYSRVYENRDDNWQPVFTQMNRLPR